MMTSTIPSRMPEVGFYYPNPFWTDGDWVKNLVLFFDGIALLVPDYMEDQLEHFDPPMITGLRHHGLLHVVKPEQAIDKAATKNLHRFSRTSLCPARSTFSPRTRQSFTNYPGRVSDTMVTRT